MSEIEIHTVNAPRGARLDDRDDAGAAVGLAKWLCLGATPTFAIMALMTGLDGSPTDKLCTSGPGALLSGMVPMYLFMSVFHSPPWLKVMFERRGGVGRPARPAVAGVISEPRSRR